MILNIFLKNFRSIKDEVTFSMVAEASKVKEDNVFIQSLARGEDEVRLLKTATIYGANASGKSSFFKGLYDIIRFIGISKPKLGEPILAYCPFQFCEETKDAPVEIFIEFVGRDKIKYKYDLAFTQQNVIREELTYWPNKKPKMLFRRIVPEDLESIKHSVVLGSDSNNLPFDVFRNQAILSKFGEDVPDEIISKVYIYIKQIDIINACNARRVKDLKDEISKIMKPETSLYKRMNELIKFADTGINGIKIRELNQSEFKLPSVLPENIKVQLMAEHKYYIVGKHSYFSNLELLREDEPLAMDEESHGTNTLFALGGRLLKALEFGEVVFVDEIDNSLHPYLSKLLICLFQNPRINSKNAQLVFTTHDTNLLERTLFRRDQIWFTEKDEYGATKLYSLQDFNDVREDTPFDKWYLAGKFGGIPNIKSLESLFVDG